MKILFKHILIWIQTKEEYTNTNVSALKKINRMQVYRSSSSTQPLVVYQLFGKGFINLHAPFVLAGVA